METYGMMAGVQIWGWDSAAGAWVKVLVNAAGKLIIDPSEIFEDPPTDGEAGKAATSNWSHDHEADVDAHHAKLHADTHRSGGVDVVLNVVTQAQPARALDTIYQNLSGKIMIVTVAAYNAATAAAIYGVYARNGATSPPATNVGAFRMEFDPAGSNRYSGTLTFLVPPNYYYEVFTISGAMTISSWTESLLF